MEKSLSDRSFATREQIKESYEQIWPKGTECACAANLESRVLLLAVAEQASILLHKYLNDNGVCPVMVPRLIGLVLASTLAINECIRTSSKEKISLRVPGLEAVIDEARAAAIHSVRASAEEASCC